MTNEVRVPDIGDDHDVPVIEVLVRPGDSVATGDPLVTLESDKATMEVPSPTSGVVESIALKVGDRVSRGSPVLVLVSGVSAPTDSMPVGGASSMGEAVAAGVREAAPSSESRPDDHPAARMPGEGRLGGDSPPAPERSRGSTAYCGPAVRRISRELGVDLRTVYGSGRHGRVLKADVLAKVREMLVGGELPVSGGSPVEQSAPSVDFAKFGPIEIEARSRIRRISATNLARNWATIPHVTNHHEADVTELDAFRRQVNAGSEPGAPRATLLAFVLVACAAALRAHSEFNVSLDGDNLVRKDYVHIGFAVDTPGGLVVPVIRHVDAKGVLEISRESAALVERAREGRLKAEEMQGGCFTVSSLGANGGGHFTPIINAPEVAVLGLAATVFRPAWDGSQFVPRLMLPLSLSWDHRALDGAAAARFNHFLVTVLGDLRRLLL